MLAIFLNTIYAVTNEILEPGTPKENVVTNDAAVFCQSTNGAAKNPNDTNFNSTTFPPAHNVLLRHLYRAFTELYPCHIHYDGYERARSEALKKYRDYFEPAFAMLKTFLIIQLIWKDCAGGDKFASSYKLQVCTNITRFTIYRRLESHQHYHLILDKGVTIETGFSWTGVVFIGANTRIRNGVSIEDGTLVGDNCDLRDQLTIDACVVIGSNCTFGTGIKVAARNIIGHHNKFLSRFYDNLEKKDAHDSLCKVYRNIDSDDGKKQDCLQQGKITEDRADKIPKNGLRYSC